MTKTRGLDGLIGYHLRRASSCLMADLGERLSDLGLRTTEASILVTLSASSGITQSEIGRRLGIQRANMAPLIAGLVSRGLIVHGKMVGRTRPLTLSPAGQRLTRDALAQMDQHEEEFFGAMPAPAKDQLLTLLRGLWRDAGDAGPT
ncbi:MAG TPA: MarR family transcriptional regulator [Sphingobium sp.]|nr:MarR family transcriptional regulator [Sphingobium sp.]